MKSKDLYSNPLQKTKWIASDEYAQHSNEHEEETANCMCVYKSDCVGQVQKQLGKHLPALHKAGGKLLVSKMQVVVY